MTGLHTFCIFHTPASDAQSITTCRPAPYTPATFSTRNSRGRLAVRFSQPASGILSPLDSHSLRGAHSMKNYYDEFRYPIDRLYYLRNDSANPEIGKWF